MSIHPRGTRGLSLTLLAAGLSFFTSAPAQAQWELGGHAIYNNVASGTWGLGARVGVNIAPVGSALFQLQGTADLYFPDCGTVGSCDLADFQLSAVFFLTRSQAYEPYLGAGLSIQPATLSGSITADQTAVGPVAFIGSTLGFWGRAEPFLEGKFLFKGDELSTQFLIQFGIIFELGKTTQDYGH